jgi:hypothetical protein
MERRFLVSFNPSSVISTQARSSASSNATGLAPVLSIRLSVLASHVAILASWRCCRPAVVSYLDFKIRKLLSAAMSMQIMPSFPQIATF